MTRTKSIEPTVKKRKPIDWDMGRALFASGNSLQSIANTLGCDKALVLRKARKANWPKASEDEIRARVTAKVTGMVTGGDPKKNEQAIDAEATRRADVIKRHRDEWNATRERLYSALTSSRNAKNMEGKKESFEDLKAAKIASETMQIIQNGERKAHNLDDAAVQQDKFGIQKSIGGVIVVPDSITADFWSISAQSQQIALESKKRELAAVYGIGY